MEQFLVCNYIRLILLLWLTGSTVLTQVSAEWQSLYYRDHPFVGKIYSLDDGAWISARQMQLNIQHEQFILLGETHSNPDHHSGQAEIIRHWLTAARPSGLVLEMLAYQDWKPSTQIEYTLEALQQTLEQVSGRWDWEIYKPILKIHIEHQLPMMGANLTKEELGQYTAGNVCQITREGKSIGVCDVLEEAQQATIKQLIFDAHCGYLPLEHTESLMRTQVAKDASFALSVSNMGQTHQVALIAGAVHVRKDIGVPVHLQRLGKKSVSIAFVNVDPDKLTVDKYIGPNELGRQFDYLYFTPSERNQDPCVEFAEQLKKMKTLTK